ncbi:MAG: hypothetical protein ABI520_09940 [Caldimonas sp.]
MLEFMKPFYAGVLGLCAAAVGLAVPLSAMAQSNQAAAPAAAVAEASGGDAQIVVRDGDTGRLRHATSEEAQALHAGRAHARRAAAAPESRSHWSGARGARLTDDFMSYSVIVKRADGKLVELCVEGGETTAKLVTSAPQFKPATLPTE